MAMGSGQQYSRNLLCSIQNTAVRLGTSLGEAGEFSFFFFLQQISGKVSDARVAVAVAWIFNL
jgi:hypothetical protein